MADAASNLRVLYMAFEANGSVSAGKGIRGIEVGSDISPRLFIPRIPGFPTGGIPF